MLNFSLGYVAIHWLVAFNTYDRYMLVVAPTIWLLAASIGMPLLARLYRHLPPLILGGILLLPLISPPSIPANREYQAVGELAETLNHDYAGRIVYDYWLGWELGWYLGEDTTVWVVYFPTPEDLAQHLKTEYGERFLLAPDTAQGQVWVALLEDYGVQIRPTIQFGHWIVYSLLPPRSVLAQFFG